MVSVTATTLFVFGPMKEEEEPLLLLLSMLSVSATAVEAQVGLVFKLLLPPLPVAVPSMILLSSSSCREAN